MNKKTLLLLTTIILAVMLAACGQSEENEEAIEQNTNDSADGVESENATEEVTIEHALGSTTLEEVPEKVIALEYTYAEDLLALGVQPVGVADIEGYKKWVDIDVDLADDVEDVGTRQEPNLETIAQLEPDLIIAPKFRHEAIKSELESIAPTIFFDQYPEEESQYDEMTATFNTIAKAVHKEDAADKVLEDLDQKYDEAKDIIEESNLTTNDYILAQAFSSQEAPVLRIFTPNALATEIFNKIGLENIYEPEEFEAFGFSTLNVESLPALEEANFFYVVQEDDNIFENQLKDNAVWNNLDFVQSDRLFPLGGDAWLFGGPLSAKTVVNNVVEVVENQ